MIATLDNPIAFEMLVKGIQDRQQRIDRIVVEIKTLDRGIARAKGYSGAFDPGVVDWAYSNAGGQNNVSIFISVCSIEAYCDETIEPLANFDRSRVRDLLNLCKRLLEENGQSVVMPKWKVKLIAGFSDEEKAKIMAGTDELTLAVQSRLTSDGGLPRINLPDGLGFIKNGRLTWEGDIKELVLHVRYVQAESNILKETSQPLAERLDAAIDLLNSNVHDLQVMLDSQRGVSKRKSNYIPEVVEYLKSIGNKR